VDLRDQPLRRPSGTHNRIIFHRLPGNKLPGYYHGAPLGLTISRDASYFDAYGVKGGQSGLLLAHFRAGLPRTVAGPEPKAGLPPSLIMVSPE